MLYEDSLLKKRSIYISVTITVLFLCAILLNSYYELNKNMQNIAFPNVMQKINEIAFNTQNQFDSLQYNSIREDYLTNKFSSNHNQNKSSLSKCVDDIVFHSQNNKFTNITPASKLDSEYSGILIGKGKKSDFSMKDMTFLCTILSTGLANSESLRLIKENPKLDSLYYFVSNDQPYFYIYNVYSNDNRFDGKGEIKFNNKFSSVSLNERKEYWITQNESDYFTNKKTTRFVKNIYDIKQELRGFLVRDVYTHNITNIIDDVFNQVGIDSHLFKAINIEIYNNDSLIYDKISDSENDTFKSEAVLNSKNKIEKNSDFGRINIKVSVCLPVLLKIIIHRDPLLIFILPIFIFIFSYMLCLQLMKGYKEGNKQYFDSLTSVYNRNGLNKILMDKVESQIRKNQDVHIFSIDANKFKQINDKYGHDMGDQAIKLIVSATRYVCKQTDDIVRMGGDEFLVLLYIKGQSEFNPNYFMQRLNQKIAYDCKVTSTPTFSVSAGTITYNKKSGMSFSQAISKADNILINKKSLDKIDVICEEFDSFDINLSQKEFDLKAKMHKKFDYIKAEHLLQEELNDKVLTAYHSNLNYLISNYFQLMYQCNRTNDNLHDYRMKIVDSHHQAGLPMSVFYFLFIKYSNFLFSELDLSDEELIVNNRVLSYELHFVSSLKL